MRRFVMGHLVFGFAACLVLPGLALGQTAAGIAGVVRDTSGAVLPGVTVEAASPALIEKVRNVVTDTAGQYRILELRPGTYSVSFSLPGFNVVKREGLDLTSGFTATVNADLPLGSVNETITVSGAAPVVDVQNTQTQSVLPTEVLDTLPVSRALQGWGVITLGVVTNSNQGSRDVGGSAGDWSGRMILHGVRGTSNVFNWFGTEGLDTRSMLIDGSRRQETNYAAVEEVAFTTAAPSAEWLSGGVSVNLVPKEGGNTFRGVLFGDYTGEALQSSNVDDALRARGVSATNATEIVFDVYGGLGGPIVKDKLWFYTAHRWKNARQQLAGLYYNKLQGLSPLPAVSTTLFYEPDFTRPAYSERPAKQYYHERFTWQAAPKHKVTLLMWDEDNCPCSLTTNATRDPAAAWWGRINDRNIQPGWTFTATNRLLVEAGFNRRRLKNNDNFENSGRTATKYGGGNVKITDRTMMDIGLGMWYSSATSAGSPGIGNGSGWETDYGIDYSGAQSARVALSYVSGSHAVKVGVSDQWGWQDYGPGYPNFTEAYQHRAGVPTGLWQIASPGDAKAAVKADLGIFAQDQWTTGRLTMNLGVRFDYINAYAPAIVRPAGLYVPELHLPELPNLPNWKDINPRVGAVYDLFGNGKTALKASFGTYVVSTLTRIAQLMSPADQIPGSVFRTWSDTNLNWIPNCDLKNPLANGECGAMDNQQFGRAVSTRRYAEDYLNGWGRRPGSKQASVSVQHELLTGFGVTAGYFRTVNDNLEFTDNLAITPADFDSYCIAAPTDSRLPGGGGNQICGLYDIKPEKFGLVDELVNRSKDFRDIFNGVDIGINARFGQGGLLTGGVSLGASTLNTCFVVDTPGQRFCKTTDSQNQFKLAGAYPLPWGMQASFTFQNLPGINQLASWVVTNAQIVPSLGRNVGACRGAATCNASVTLPLVEPGTLREPRQSQLDIRFGKTVRVGGVRIEPKFEVFNALNANDAQTLVTQFGSRWLNVNGLLAGRLFKFGAQVNF